MKTVIYPLLLVAGALALTAPAHAQSSGRQETLAQLAGDVKHWVGGRGNEIRLGALEGDPQPAANAAPGLCLELGRMLAALKVAVTAKARFELRGKYELKKDSETSRLVVELTAWIVDTKLSGRVVVRLRPRDFTYVEEVVALLGLTVSLDPEAPDAQREKVIADSRDDEREAPIRGTQALGKAKGRYAVEVLVKEGKDRFQALTPRSQKGCAYVALSRADVYAVRLTNHSGQEAAVELFIDGLNVFTFSEMADRKGYPRLLLPPGGSATLKGWPLNLKESKEFLVTGYPRTAAFTQGIRPGSLGVITATFAPAYEKGKKPKGAKSAAGPYGTGFGERIETRFKAIPREFGPVADCVTVRNAVK
jgi:hypothetical protein